jgi:peptidyl-prolyl cis-trans isomerase A (cyclophilin A)
MRLLPFEIDDGDKRIFLSVVILVALHAFTKDPLASGGAVGGGSVAGSAFGGGGGRNSGAFEPAVGTTVEVDVTGYGRFRIGLFDSAKPITVGNFMQYVQEGYYSGTTFHRIMRGFVLQGGGVLANGNRKMSDRKPILPENNGKFIPNKPGTIAMARALNRADTQFFVNLVHNSHLDGLSGDDRGNPFTVFGKVTRGMHVVNKIVNTAKMSPDKQTPLRPPVIKSIAVVSPGSAAAAAA